VLGEMIALEPGLIAYAASPAVQGLVGERVRRVRPRALASAGSVANALRLGWHQTLLPRRLGRDGASVYYSTVPDGMLRPSCPQVVTIHDLIPLHYPDASPRLQHYFRHVVPRVIRASAAVIAMSEATRRDLVAFYGVDPGRVHVVYQGYREDFFHPGPAEEAARVRTELGVERYLLAVGEGRPYKNIPRLLEAFARLRPRGVTLVVAGRASPREVDLPARAASLGIGDHVRFLGYVPDERLARLYRGAEAFVFPSLYEGFGIPPLEAMASGCPVVASDRASVPEVCADAAVYVDPSDVGSIVDGVERMLGDEGLRTRLREAGVRRAAEFSYAGAAERILAVLRPLAGMAGAECAGGEGSEVRGRRVGWMEGRWGGRGNPNRRRSLGHPPRGRPGPRGRRAYRRREPPRRARTTRHRRQGAQGRAKVRHR
jgi:glycosyltransferase involved in cell wall biosynthesis